MKIRSNMSYNWLERQNDENCFNSPDHEIPSFSKIPHVFATLLCELDTLGIGKVDFEDVF